MLRATMTILWVGCVPLAANAALTEHRAQVQLSSGSGTGTQFALGGGLNATSALQTISAGSSSGIASASLGSDGFVPTLRVRATNAGQRIQSIAWGVQGYTNTAATPLETALIVNLSADISGANDLEARVYMFETEDFEFRSDSGTILFESSSQLFPGFEDRANNLGPEGFDIQFKNAAGAVEETRTFDFTLAPGDSFYIWARFVATADNAGEVDAFSTLTASFSNTTGLAPAAIDPVPIPATLPLLGGALLCLAGWSRAKR